MNNQPTMQLDRNNAIIISGPVIFSLLLFFLPDTLPFEAKAIIASTTWIALWWVTEAIPIAITSLLPMILFPMTGIMGLREVTAPYANPLIYLFIGGFILALCMEKWNLHRRIALNIIHLIGVNKRMLILGFIAATGFLSMWISNTATTVMMLPIALSILQHASSMKKEEPEDQKFSKALILSLPYAASIGGMATLVGSPTNLIFADAVNRFYNIDIPFDQWMMVALPISLLLLLATWLHLTRNVYKISNKEQLGSKDIIGEEIKKLGKMSTEEKWVLAIFCAVALAWVTRRFLITPFFPVVNDTIIVLIGATLLFVIPSQQQKGQKLMDWETAVKIPWGVLILFGGAFAVAAGFQASGLTTIIGNQLSGLAGIPLLLLLLIIILVVNFMTELTMNMATCTLMMPILATLALGLDVHPFTLMVGTCIAASCAFMLPVATAPNAVAFGSGKIRVSDMFKAGFMLNILSILIISLAVYFLIPMFWNIDIFSFPESLKN
jgi:sodium-dependent dicarboxylate transporter 2/3/5